MDSILLAVIVGLTVWLFMRQMRIKRMRQMQAQQARAAEGGEPKTMERLGTPGTVTREQLARLKALDFAPDRGWSSEEAALIIDSVMYLRAAIEDATGETDAPLEIQNNVLALILTDEDLRDYIQAWGDNRRQKAETGPPARLRKNEHYDRIVEHILSLRDDD